MPKDPAARRMVMMSTMGSRVLIADDDRSIRESLRRALTLEGYEVFSAVNGEDALESIRRASPDLAVLDVMMPRMD